MIFQSRKKKNIRVIKKSVLAKRLVLLKLSVKTEKKTIECKIVLRLIALRSI